MVVMESQFLSMFFSCFFISADPTTLTSHALATKHASLIFPTNESVFFWLFLTACHLGKCELKQSISSRRASTVTCQWRNLAEVTLLHFVVVHWGVMEAAWIVRGDQNEACTFSLVPNSLPPSFQSLLHSSSYFCLHHKNKLFFA